MSLPAQIQPIDGGLGGGATCPCPGTPPSTYPVLVLFPALKTQVFILDYRRFEEK